MHIVSQSGARRQSDSADAYVIGRATAYLLNRLAERLNAELRAVLRPFRLTLRHWRVLAFLAPSGPVPIVALARDAPAIAGQIAVLAHHAMARQHHRHRIVRAGRPDRPDGVGVADPSGHLGVALGRAVRDVGQALDELLVAGRRAEVAEDPGAKAPRRQRS